LRFQEALIGHGIEAQVVHAAGSDQADFLPTGMCDPERLHQQTKAESYQ
jgi:hypothetical protein